MLLSFGEVGTRYDDSTQKEEYSTRQIDNHIHDQPFVFVFHSFVFGQDYLLVNWQFTILIPLFVPFWTYEGEIQRSEAQKIKYM